MQPLVLQLQAECLDTNVSILEVTRKALVVARKLSLKEAQAWIEKELNGYKNGDSAPPHRLLTGQIVAWNPYRGWISVAFQNFEEAACRSKCFVGQPVGELEDLVKQEKTTLEFPFDSETELLLMRSLNARLRPTRHLSRSSVCGILDAVRNMVLELCLRLEKDGILGEGMVFSGKEKDAAAHSNYTVNYNAPVSHSQIQQGSPHAVQNMTVSESDMAAITDFIHMLNKHSHELRLDADGMRILGAEVQAIEAQAAAPSPNRPVLRESLRSIRNLLEGCAGSLISSGLLFELGKLLN